MKTPEADSNATEKTLNDDVLNKIGKRLIEDRTFSEPIHSAFTERWTDVIKVGLPKEERKELIKKFPLPKNCTFLDPPKLNKEIKLSVGESCQARDARIVEKHEKLLACLSANSSVLKEMLKVDDNANLTAIEILSGASSLIIDALHDETAMRRALILGNVNPSMKDVLSATVPDEFLFGKDLSELLKQTLTTHKDMQVLSKKPVAPTSNRTKNSKGPQRPTSRSQTTTTNGQQRSAPGVRHESKRKNDQQKSQTDQTKYSGRYYPKKR